MTRLRFAMLPFCVWLLCTPALTFAGFAEGVAAAKVGDFATALREFKPLAERGNAAAQTKLGVMYAEGYGVPKDYQESVRWYRLSADQGDSEAQRGLGLMYERGNGVPQDYQQAQRWYRLAAIQGNATAQANLGQLYDDGVGIQRDLKEALKWYRLAASHGNSVAQTNLAVMYFEGQGVPANKVVAYALLNLAATTEPDGIGASNQNKLAATMTPSSVDTAQELTRKMLAPGQMLKVLDAFMAK